MVDAAGMKTVYLNRDYYYTPHPKFSVAFKSGTVYARVLDAAATAIEAAGAGRVVPDDGAPRDDGAAFIDASRTWTTFGARIKKRGRG